MAIMTEDQLVLAVELGGAEDGTPTWPGSPTTITCNAEDFSDMFEAVTVDVTTRCSTLTLTKRIRETGTINLTVDGLEAGWVFGTGANQYVRLTVTDASLTAQTFTCVLRSNERSRPRGGRARQTVRLEVQSYA